MKAGSLELDGVNFDMIPWMCKENEQEIFEFIKNSSSPYCCGHFELAGFPMMRGVESHDGIEDKFLSNYNQVFSGHYHTFSERDNVTYLGTPYELFWSDYKDTKKFAIFDTDTAKVEYIANPYRMFFKLNYDDSSLTMNALKEIPYDKYANSYVKVIVLNKQNPYLFDKLLDELYKVDPVDVTIVEDFSDVNVETDEEIVDQAQDTMTILSNYIDGQSLNITDTTKLKNVMKELYIEALSTENT